MSTAFQKSQAYKNGSWIPFDTLAWSVTDFGTTHGAMLVERLRTIGGSLYSIDKHLRRLEAGAAKLGISWSASLLEIRSRCEELIERNHGLIENEGDVGCVVLVSPGDPGLYRQPCDQPTVIIHLTPLPIEQLKKWYQEGTALHISPTRNVPPECWSPSIKTRSRLQYYLADQRLDGHVPQSSESSTIENATRRSKESIAVLLSTRGFVTETSVANLLILGNDGVLRSPKLVDILHGVSLEVVHELANAISQPMEYRDLDATELYEAAEILLTGTSGCLWSATSMDGQSIGDGRPGRLCKRLQEAWIAQLGYDIIAPPR